MAESGFWWVLLACGLYGALHSALASHAAKGWAERRFGETARRTYRLGYVIIAALTGLLLLLFPLALRRFLPDPMLYAIPMPWVLLTLALQTLAALGVLQTVRLTGAAAFLGLQQLSRPAPLRTRSGPEQLVSRGFYRYVRHPIYSFSFLLIWLMPVVTWNILALMIGLTVYTFIGTLLEERKLSEEFGPAYAEYRRRTPMVFPRIWPGR